MHLPYPGAHKSPSCVKKMHARYIELYIFQVTSLRNKYSLLLITMWVEQICKEAVRLAEEVLDPLGHPLDEADQAVVLVGLLIVAEDHEWFVLVCN